MTNISLVTIDRYPFLPPCPKFYNEYPTSSLPEYLDKNNFISAYHYCFKKAKSTADAEFCVTDTVITKLDESKKFLPIFLGVAKAFDTISIPLSIKKLERIRGNQLKLFENYLNVRTQSVRKNQ